MTSALDLEISKGTLTVLGEGKTIHFSHRALLVSGDAVLNLGSDGSREELTLTSDANTASVILIANKATLNMYDGVTIRDSISRGTAAGVQINDKVRSICMAA